MRRPEPSYYNIIYAEINKQANIQSRTRRLSSASLLLLAALLLTGFIYALQSSFAEGKSTNQSQTPQTSSPSDEANLLIQILTANAPYVIVSGDSLTLNGPTTVITGKHNMTIDDVRRIKQNQKGAKPGTPEYISVEQNGKSYYIDDFATVERAKAFFQPVKNSRASREPLVPNRAKQEKLKAN